MQEVYVFTIIIFNDDASRQHNCAPGFMHTIRGFETLAVAKSYACLKLHEIMKQTNCFSFWSDIPKKLQQYMEKKTEYQFKINDDYLNNYTIMSEIAAAAAESNVKHITCGFTWSISTCGVNKEVESRKKLKVKE